MTDYLLDLSKNQFAKKLVKQFKLPIPLPEPLRRPTSPWSDTELQDLQIAVGGARGAKLAEPLRQLVALAGASLPADYTPEQRLDALVFDGTPIVTTGDLGHLYDFIKPRLKSLAPNGRIVLVGPSPSDARAPEGAAVAEALVGFAKSLAKEIGRKGCTCNVLLTPPDAQDTAHLSLPVRFLLSSRSAFVSGQALTLRPAADVPATGARSLAGKVALVTGAAHGIGAAIARHLAAEGARVLGLDRPQEKAAIESLMAELGGTPLVADLLDPHAARSVTARVAAESGAVDILVNNAGITRDKTLARMPRDWWDDTLAINLTAPVRLTEAFVNGEDDLLKLLNPGGRVICMSSIGGIAGNAGQTNYAAAKAGLIGYVRALAPRVAPRGITINAIAPGFIETRMTQAMPLGVREVARRFNALSQAGIPDDVAEAVVFLASPGASAVNGQVLRVCGLNLIGA